MPACYLGSDVGGTFTDLVFYTASGEVHCFKVPSTPSRPGASILEGIDEIKAALGLDDAAWGQMVHTHSSTVATNALIERKGARIGLLVSSGFRDLFELQRLAIPHDWVEETPTGKLSKRLPATGIVFRETIMDYENSWHPAPCRQDVFSLAGGIEITASDGETRHIGVGEIVLVEDTTGKGHITKSSGGRPRHTIFVPID